MTHKNKIQTLTIEASRNRYIIDREEKFFALERKVKEQEIKIKQLEDLQKPDYGFTNDSL